MDLPYSLHFFDGAYWVEKHALSDISLIAGPEVAMNIKDAPTELYFAILMTSTPQSVPLGSTSQLWFDIEHPNLTNHGSSAVYDEETFRKSTIIRLNHDIS